MGDWTGTIPFLLAGHIPDAEEWGSLTDSLYALSSAWTEYPGLTWTASSVNPAIVNGLLTAHYTQVDSLVLYKGAIVMGGSTTFGTGYWILTMPVAATLGSRNVGVAALHDTSASTADRAGALELLSSTTFRVVANGRTDATTPFTWASGDILQWFIVYEAA